MPADEPRNRRNGDQKSWAGWKQELFEAIEDLDESCANARQTIYRLRPLVRPKSAEKGDEPTEREPRTVPFRGRRRERRERE